jgi:hypothetical protein
MTKRPKKSPVTHLPATLFEAEAVDIIVGWIDVVTDRLKSEHGRQVLRASMAQKLKAGAISRMRVIAAAKAGDQDAEAVLRELIVEIISRKAEMPTELEEYNMWIMAGFSPVNSGGRDVGNYWHRDIGIAVLAGLAQQQWPSEPKTRSHHSKRNDRGLSICLLISRALGRRGINLTERGVETVLDGKLEAKLAERLSFFCPPA